MPEASAQILRILLNCGMIAREEQEIVRALIRSSARAGLGARPAVPPARPPEQPQLL